VRRIRAIVMRWRAPLCIYAAGFVLTAGYCCWQAIDNGALTRNHDLSDYLQVAVFYGRISIMWPLAWVLAALVYANVVGPITF